MIDMFRAGVAAAAIIGCVASAAAEARDLRPYVSPQFRIINSDDDRNTDAGYGLEAAFGMAVTQKWGFELGLFYEEYDGALSCRLRRGSSLTDRLASG